MMTSKGIKLGHFEVQLQVAAQILMHWGLHKMVNILQTFLNAFSWKNNFVLARRVDIITWLFSD